MILRNKKDIQQRIQEHKDYLNEMLETLQTNPNLKLGAASGITIALNEIEELEWVLGQDNTLEAPSKVSKQEKNLEK